MTTPKLTECELALLAECCEYNIMDDRTIGYYRLGGHGNAPIRYHHARMRKLERLELVHRNGGYVATKKGKELISKQKGSK